ncbi:MAG: hypothetical protein ACMXYA_01460 [Candidatus Woesearchaeota archaeon]
MKRELVKIRGIPHYTIRPEYGVRETKPEHSTLPNGIPSGFLRPIGGAPVQTGQHQTCSMQHQNELALRIWDFEKRLLPDQLLLEDMLHVQDKNEIEGNIDWNDEYSVLVQPLFGNIADTLSHPPYTVFLAKPSEYNSDITRAIPSTSQFDLHHEKIILLYAFGTNHISGASSEDFRREPYSDMEVKKQDLDVDV